MNVLLWKCHVTNKFVEVGKAKQTWKSVSRHLRLSVSKVCSANREIRVPASGFASFKCFVDRLLQGNLFVTVFELSVLYLCILCFAGVLTVTRFRMFGSSDGTLALLFGEKLTINCILHNKNVLLIRNKNDKNYNLCMGSNCVTFSFYTGRLLCCEFKIINNVIYKLLLNKKPYTRPWQIRWIYEYLVPNKTKVNADLNFFFDLVQGPFYNTVITVVVFYMYSILQQKKKQKTMTFFIVQFFHFAHLEDPPLQIWLWSLIYTGTAINQSNDF